MKIYSMCIGCLFFLLSLATAQAADIRLAWDAPSSGTPTGYKLYQGVEPGVYTVSKDVGLVLAHNMSNLVPGQTYYFAATAYNSTSESGFSNEVSVTIPVNGLSAPQLLKVTITIEMPAVKDSKVRKK